MNKSIKQTLLKRLARGVDKAIERQDRGTGRFLTPEGGWAVYLQDPIYTMAMLYTRPGTAWFHHAGLLGVIARGGDALRDFQDADGRWEFIKPDGSSWGRSYMPWTVYHWLETYALVREYLDAPRAERWATGLKLCYSGLAEEISEPVAHNIPNWHGMSLVRGSQVFDRPEWAEVGGRQCLFTVPHQHRDGYWPEGGGPTNGYNTIYVHALGLYYTFTEDRRVLPCLEKACRFNSTFTYPDGTPVETIDGRQNYEKNSRYYGWPGFALFPQGRRLVSLHTDALMADGSDELFPQVAAFIQHGTTGPEASLPWQRENRVVHGDSALVRRNGPWFATVSGYSPPAAYRTAIGRQRFIMTRSNSLSVWHAALGLLIGGGNSKHDPFFSTFDVGDKGARRLEPDAVFFNPHSKGEGVRFLYGEHVCLLDLTWRSDEVLELSFEIPPDTRDKAVVLAGFTMRLERGSSVAWQGNGVEGEATLDAQTATEVDWGTPAMRGKRVIAGRGWSLEMPDESTFVWPVYPHNPYAVNNASDASFAVAAVSFAFERKAKRTFLLRVD